MRPRAALLLLLALIALATNAAQADAVADAPSPSVKLEGPSGTAIAFSRNGGHILTAGKNEARVWDGRTFKPVTGPIRHWDGGDFVGIAVSSDGKLVLTATEREVRVCDGADGHELWTLPWAASLELPTASFSPDGRQVVVGSRQGKVTIRDALTGKPGLDLGEEGVGLAAFSPDGSRIITVTIGGVFENDQFLNTLIVWDAATGRKLAHRFVDDAGSHLIGRVAAFSPDGKRLATMRSGRLQIGATDEAHGGDVVDAGVATTFAFSPDGTRLATTDGSGFVALRDAVTGKLLKELDYSNYAAQALFSPDGRRLLTPFEGFGAAVYDLTSGQRVLSIPTHDNKGWPWWGDAPAAAWSPDGRRVAVGFAGDEYTGVYEVQPNGGK